MYKIDKNSVIVEMTVEQYDVLAQRQEPQAGAEPDSVPVSAQMTLKEKVAYIGKRILKLRPKKVDGLVRSVSAMFQFTGGIGEEEIQEVIEGLRKEKVLAIDAENKVRYMK